MFGTPYQGVTPDQHHTQSFENQVTSDAVIAFNPPVRAWYPSAPGRVRALFIFYVFSFIITLGYFVVYTVVEHPMGPLLYGQTEPAEFGWHFIYFSYWVGMLHILFFLMAIIDLWQRQSEWSEQFHAYKDKFYDILFALTTLIFVTYWFTVFPNRLSDHNVRSTNLFIPCIYLSIDCSTIYLSIYSRHHPHDVSIEVVFPPPFIYYYFFLLFPRIYIYLTISLRIFFVISAKIFSNMVSLLSLSLLRPLLSHIDMLCILVISSGKL